MDIKSLSSQSIFSFDTEKIGLVNTHSTNFGMLGKIGKYDFEKGDAKDFVNFLLKIVCKNGNNQELTDEDINKISFEEKETFIKSYIENDGIFYERKHDIKDNEEGQRVVKIRKGELKKSKLDSENYHEYLFRIYPEILDDFNKTITAPFKRIGDLFKLNTNSFSPAFTESINKSAYSAKQLQGLIERDYSAHNELLYNIRNLKTPADTTNEKLNEVIANLEYINQLGVKTAQTVKDVSDASTQFLVEFKIASDNADKTSRRALFIAVGVGFLTLLSIIVPIGYQEYKSTKEVPLENLISSIEDHTSKISKEINAYSEAQKDALESQKSNDKLQNQMTVKTLNELNETLEILKNDLQNSQEE